MDTRLITLRRYHNTASEAEGGTQVNAVCSHLMHNNLCTYGNWDVAHSGNIHLPTSLGNLLDRSGVIEWTVALCARQYLTRCAVRWQCGSATRTHDVTIAQPSEHGPKNETITTT